MMDTVSRKALAALFLLSVAAVPHGAAASDFAVGFYHLCYLDTAHKAKCLGVGSSGQLGSGNGVDSLQPETVAGDHAFIDITVGNTHSCGVEASGVVLCWGYGEEGQLGSGSSTSSAVPVAVAQGATPYFDVAAGAQTTCAISVSGSTACWGVNSYTSLGDPAFDAGEGISAVPRATAVPAAFMQIDGMDNGTCGLTAAGTAWCWGESAAANFGVAGNPDAPASWSQGAYSSVGKGGGFGCAVTLAGVMECWGFSGPQAGGITPGIVATPVAMTALALGSNHGCAMGVDAQVYCWGADTSLLGNPANDGTQPRAIAQPGPFVDLDASATLTCASKMDGSLWCWGYLAKGSFLETYLPVPTRLQGVGVYVDAVFASGFEAG
jgi:alpha-tubulin suppressor-like RCC1 family protein